MAKVLPPKGFAGAGLHIHEVPAGQRFGRIYLGRYPDSLGFGKTPSRFSDPRRRVATNRFGVLYLGDTVKACFLEALICDQRDGAIGDLPMEEAELHDRHYAEIEITVSLKMIDLRDVSQNWKVEVCSLSGQAQPGQSKPSGLFVHNSSSGASATCICSATALAVARSAPHPPAGAS